jgi:hypothetical protein
MAEVISSSVAWKAAPSPPLSSCTHQRHTVGGTCASSTRAHTHTLALALASALLPLALALSLPAALKAAQSAPSGPNDPVPPFAHAHVSAAHQHLLKGCDALLDPGHVSVLGRALWGECGSAVSALTCPTHVRGAARHRRAHTLDENFPVESAPARLGTASAGIAAAACFRKIRRPDTPSACARASQVHQCLECPPAGKACNGSIPAQASPRRGSWGADLGAELQRTAPHSRNRSGADRHGRGCLAERRRAGRGRKKHTQSLRHQLCGGGLRVPIEDYVP